MISFRAANSRAKLVARWTGANERTVISKEAKWSKSVDFEPTQKSRSVIE